MAAWMPFIGAAVATPVLLAFGITLEGERLHDTAPRLAIDARMDARITPYVPVVRASEAARRRGGTALLSAASLWREGRLSGRLLDPMPARYGDNTGGEGARSELVTSAIVLSGLLLSEARKTEDRARAKIYLAAAFEPLRTVQYADLGAMAKIAGRRITLVRAMEEEGFSHAEAERTGSLLRPDAKRLSGLLQHMSRLRNAYRARYADEAELWDADPYFETVVQGKSQHFRLVARG